MIFAAFIPFWISKNVIDIYFSYFHTYYTIIIIIIYLEQHEKKYMKFSFVSSFRLLQWGKKTRYTFPRLFFSFTCFTMVNILIINRIILFKYPRIQSMIFHCCCYCSISSSTTSLLMMIIQIEDNNQKLVTIRMFKQAKNR